MKTILFADVVQNIFAELGLVEPNPLADGSLHRCATVAKPRKKNGAYLLSLDVYPYIWAKNWETDCVISVKGCVQSQTDPISDQARVQKRSLWLKEKERAEKECAKKARYLWDHCFFSAKASNPYLVRKCIPRLGAKETYDGSLVIPVFFGKELVNLQFINAQTGEKRFLKGGRVNGCFLELRKKQQSNGLICIAEGYATSASIAQSLGCTVFCAFFCGNLAKVARCVRQWYPNAALCLCADYDTKSKRYPNAGGIGLAKALEAARSVGGYVAVPAFEKKGDFNDLFVARGAKALRSCLEKRFLA